MLPSNSLFYIPCSLLDIRYNIEKIMQNKEQGAQNSEVNTNSTLLPGVNIIE